MCSLGLYRPEGDNTSISCSRGVLGSETVRLSDACSIWGLKLEAVDLA